MSDSEVLIRADGLSKRFCRDLRKSLWYGVTDACSDFLSWRDRTDEEPSLRSGEFWANRDISFEVRRGECLGLIGRNGAGKTTLLKMLSSLLKPDSGSVEVRGRVGGLIALGAGFSPILTGRENIFVNGSILGLSRKAIQDSVDKIVDFADISDAIDAPVQTYSSGMQVRLGFAIAVCLIEPDVLFLDEVLAVGDVAFRAKCYNEISRLKSHTATIFVSHQMNLVSLYSDRGLVLDQGATVCDADVNEAIHQYNLLNQQDSKEGRKLIHDEIASARLELLDPEIEPGGPLTIRCQIDSRRERESVFWDIIFYSSSGECVGQWDGHHNGRMFGLKAGLNAVDCLVKSVCLASGTYDVGIVLRCFSEKSVLIWSYKEMQIEIKKGNHGAVAYQMQ